MSIDQIKAATARLRDAPVTTSGAYETVLLSLGQWQTLLTVIDKLSDWLEGIRQVSTEEAGDDASEALTEAAEMLKGTV